MPNPYRYAIGAPCAPASLDSAQRLCPAFFMPTAINKEVPNMAKVGARVKITLRCSECKQRNYNTSKNKKNDPDRLEMNKYCPFCRKNTVHNETK